MTINSAVPADVAEKQFNGGGDCDEQERDAAIQSIVDDILDGKAVKSQIGTHQLYDFFVDEIIYPEDFEALIIGTEEQRESVINRTKKHADTLIRNWCDASPYGQFALSERITQLREYTRERAGE